MKATGIIRRIDDLGRIAIPKNVRQNLGIEAGDAFEVCAEAGNLILVPYNAERTLATDLRKIFLMHEHDEQDNDKYHEVLKKIMELAKELD